MNKLRIPLVALGLATTCSGAFATEYGTVISSTPVTRQVAVPGQQCADQQGYVQAPPSGAGALAGAVIGGLAGNALGAGAGRALATGVGALTGAAVGNSVEAANAPVQPVTTTNCVYTRAVESRVVGYDVVYEYNGQQRTARLAKDPGSQIALAVSPVADASPPDAVPLDMATAARGAYTAPYPAYPVPVYDPYPYGSYGYGYVGLSPLSADGALSGVRPRPAGRPRPARGRPRATRRREGSWP
jgi:uncharacterized protein YcfJ